MTSYDNSTLPKMEIWGWHLSFDGCNALDKTKVQDADNIKAFSRELVQRIDMEAFGEPICVHFGKENKTGYTLVQLIQTSNICGHFCDDSGNAYIDIFSCKPFETEIVKNTIQEFFNFETYRITKFDRGTFPAVKDVFPKKEETTD